MPSNISRLENTSDTQVLRGSDAWFADQPTQIVLPILNGVLAQNNAESVPQVIHKPHVLDHLVFSMKGD